MKRQTILYISSPAANNGSVTIELEATGYEVVRTDSATQGIALLYIMHSVAAIVLHPWLESKPALMLREAYGRFTHMC